MVFIFHHQNESVMIDEAIQENSSDSHQSDQPLKVIMPKVPRLCSCRKSKSFSFSPIVHNGPISSKEALSSYSSLLMPYEVNEIQRFKEIYFLGYPNVKNQALHDANYHYRFNPKDHLAYRYEIVKVLGSGAFGKVVEAIDHKTKKQIAIKILINAEDVKEQSKTEASILACLNKHKCSNTIKGIDYFYFRSHACITFELLGESLYLTQIRSNFKPLRQSAVKEYAIQIFQALRDCANLGIIHCDLKLENICSTLEDSKKIKIIDFGSSCFEDKPYRTYIQSRYYRAPEVILGLKYGPKIDVWSAALIIIELLTGKPVFPGKNELDMLNLMVDLLGPIPRHMVKHCRKKGAFFQENGTLKAACSLKPKKKEVSIPILLGPDTSPQLVDFLEKCLTWSPRSRMTALDALDHPWLQTKFPSKDSESLPCLQKLLPLVE